MNNRLLSHKAASAAWRRSTHEQRPVQAPRSCGIDDPPCNDPRHHSPTAARRSTVRLPEVGVGWQRAGTRGLAAADLAGTLPDWMITRDLDTGDTEMNRASSTVAIGLLALTVLSGSALAYPPDLKTLAIGADAPTSLPGVDGKTYSLRDFASAKLLVVIFTCNHCPTAQAYEGRLARFQADYSGKGVSVVAISPNDPAAVRLDELGFTDVSDSFEDMKILRKDHQFNYPYLYDGQTQSTALAYGVLATPHVYVFDSARRTALYGPFPMPR